MRENKDCVGDGWWNGWGEIEQLFIEPKQSNESD